MGRSWNGKPLQIWKERQGLQPPQQSNKRREARERSSKKKRSLARWPISLRPNGYAKTINRENKMKQAVKLYQSIKKRKAEEKASRDNKANQNNDQNKSITVNGNENWCDQDKLTINKTQLCRKRTNIMTS